MLKNISTHFTRSLLMKYEIFKLSKCQLVQETPRILGNYPNTYTFTKSMAERILKKKRGDLPLTIVRPSVVGASYKVIL
jgi:thioester reductase-like protein